MTIDFQDRLPDIQEKIDRVGVEGIRSWIKVVRNGKEFVHVPIIDVYIDLQRTKKGIHMSRLVESIGEALEEQSTNYGICNSLEEFGDKVLRWLSKKSQYDRAEIKIKT